MLWCNEVFSIDLSSLLFAEDAWGRLSGGLESSYVGLGILVGEFWLDLLVG